MKIRIMYIFTIIKGKIYNIYNLYEDTTKSNQIET